MQQSGELWAAVLMAYDSIRHYVNHGYWYNLGRMPRVVPKAAKADLLWLASRT